MALKMYAEGHTSGIQNLCPGLYSQSLTHEILFLSQEGGTVLTAIEKGSPYRVETYPGPDGK